MPLRRLRFSCFDADTLYARCHAYADAAIISCRLHDIFFSPDDAACRMLLLLYVSIADAILSSRCLFYMLYLSRVTTPFFATLYLPPSLTLLTMLYALFDGSTVCAAILFDYALFHYDYYFISPLAAMLLYAASRHAAAAMLIIFRFYFFFRCCLHAG